MLVPFKFFTTSAFLLFGYTRAQTECRDNGLFPHQSTLWNDNFPNGENDEKVIALCDGEISINGAGEVCVDGRVTYRQIQEFTGMPTYAPTSNTISITGHLIAGDAYTMLGDKFVFLYDLVSSYTINGTTYEADDTMVDNVLAASKGAIEGICYKTDFVRNETEYIKINHKIFLEGEANAEELEDATVIFASALGLVGEYYTKVEDKPSILSNFRLSLQNSVSNSPTPDELFQIFPIFSLVPGLRALIVGGVVSTDVHPQPLTAPDAQVEDIQIDTEWSTLLKVIDSGVFDDGYPLFSLGLIRKVTILEGGFSCWRNTTEAAVIDITIPPGRAEEIDEFVVNKLYPAIKEQGGNVGLHLGKRIPNDSTELMNDVFDFYARCGMTVPDTKPEPCYHPLCSRQSIPTTFEYPSEFFDISSKSEL